jgi:hypothetical protein
MRYFLLVIFLLISLTCGAAIYMQKDANGNITYSDMASPTATRVDLPPAPTTTFAPAAPAAAKSKTSNTASTTPDAPATDSDQHVDYTAFFINSPTDQQTFQNQRDVAVDISVTPALQKGDAIQIIVDGNKVGPPAASTHFQVNQLPRGTHQVSAELLDGNKAVLKQAPAINFFVHYAALGGAGS